MAAASLGRVRLVVGPHEVILDNPQWGFAQSAQYVEQVESVLPSGILYRRPFGFARHGYHTLRFPRTDTVIESLRAVSHYAGRTGERVYVVPDMDTAPGVFWWVDWNPEIDFTRIIENREEVVLHLVEQSEVPA